MPAVRPYWKGYIKLALVSCPIGLTASSSGERVAFRQINKKTGNRLRQQLIDDETREPVEAHEKGRGYEYAKGSYLMIEDHELDAIEIESNHTIEIDSFVPREEIDERFLDSPYYIAPNEPVGQEAFAVTREAMRGKDMVALGRVVLSKRERVIMLQPWDKGLLGTTLRYPYELREAKDYFYDIADVKVEPELLALAQHILKTKEAKFDPTRFVDRYEQAVIEMLQQKQAGLPATVKTFPPPRSVTDLMEAFRQSLASVLAPKPRMTKASRPGHPSRRSLRLRSRGRARCCCRSRAGKPRSKQGRRKFRSRGGRRADVDGRALAYHFFHPPFPSPGLRRDCRLADFRDQYAGARAGPMTARGKDEDCGRLAAWAGLDLGGRHSQARRSACPAPGALRSIICPMAAAPRYLVIFILGDQRTHLGAFLLLLVTRHDQGLEGDRAAVGAAVLELLLVAVLLRSHLADQPFARIDLQPTMFDHIGFGRFDSRIIPFTSAYGLSALLRSIGDLMDFVE